MKTISVRKYTYSDQKKFAELSGDYNPAHLDTIGTRRELFGDVVVHGIHAVLRALDHNFALIY